MNKLIIALPLLALLAVGSVFLLNSKKTVSDIAGVTIDQWQHCFQTLPYNYCDQLSNPADLSDCYAAAKANSDLVWDGANLEIPACQSFYTYFKRSQAGDLLNANNYYADCFDNSNAVAAAEKSFYYYGSIYAPKYLTCAGLSA